MTASFAGSPPGLHPRRWPRGWRGRSITIAAISRLISERPMTETPIPQADPRAGYLEHRAAINAAIARVLDSGQYILGREAETFETRFAGLIGVAHAIGCGNGTDALELAVRACGIVAGDLVFTVSHTAV